MILDLSVHVLSITAITQFGTFLGMISTILALYYISYLISTTHSFQDSSLGYAKVAEEARLKGSTVQLRSGFCTYPCLVCGEGSGCSTRVCTQCVSFHDSFLSFLNKQSQTYDFLGGLQSLSGVKFCKASVVAVVSPSIINGLKCASRCPHQSPG
jgi:hypothetical protein